MSARIADLQDVLRNFGQQKPELTSRLERAACLLVLRHILVIDEGHYRVESEDGRRWYEVSEAQCGCVDFQRHGPGHACKHLLAVAIAAELGILRDRRVCKDADP